LNRLKILAILPLVLSAVLIAGLPTVKAATGVVCINAVGTTGCPASPAQLPLQAVGSSLTVAVNIAGSDGLSGASVSVLTNPAILNPISISSVGTVVPGSTLTLTDCVNGVPQGGAQCTTGVDGVGVASLGILSLGGTTIAPTTGHLFSITYNVVSATSATIGFQTSATNCSGQSVSGTTDCILITAGAAVLSETALVAQINPTKPTITAPVTATGPVGLPLTIPVSASDINVAEVVTLTATGLPAGATFTTTGTNPVNGMITWTPTVGQQSSTVTLTATDNEAVPQSATASIVVSSQIGPPTFVSVKEAAHHLNLAKTTCSCQTFTATVSSNNLGTVYAQVTVTGTAGTASFTATSAITTVSGVTSVVITFNTANLTPFIGVKFHWTAMIQYSASPTLSGALTSPSTHSSAFAVV
jgi:hypothetical protein